MSGRGVPTPRQIRRLGIVGSGFMGSGIAGTAVLNVEVDTRLKDADLDPGREGTEGGDRASEGAAQTADG